MFERFLSDQGLNSHSSSYEFSSLEAIKQCVLCGLRIALVHKITVIQELEQHRLKARPIDKKYGYISTYLAYRKDKWISPLMNYFIEEVNMHFFKKSHEVLRKLQH
ncbi:LysR substrate-binding domain-containing protein [Neobacillus sp. BF23-41]|uniref:LysR substrate-binding domain-containing protein n=1 Tax=Neobacillus sp. BF23-41 TaxID=3240280 RepID=UPI0034E446B7